MLKNSYYFHLVQKLFIFDIPEFYSQPLTLIKLFVSFSETGKSPIL